MHIPVHSLKLTVRTLPGSLPERKVYLDLPFVCEICAEIHQENLPILAEILHI